MSAYQDYLGAGVATPGGHYRFGFKSGAVTGLTAAQVMFCFRWTDSTRYCRLRQIKVAAGMKTAFGTAQISDLAVYKCTAWSTAPTAGVTLTAPGTNANIMADTGTTTSMSQGSSIFPTLSNNVAISNTGALTDGSPTVDANAFGNDTLNIIALGSCDRVTLYDVSNGFDYPITFGVNEGFEIQVPTAQGASGVIVYYVTVVFAANNATF